MMPRINGVAVYLKVNQDQVIPAVGGYIGELEKEDLIELTAWTGKNFHGFLVTGKKNSNERLVTPRKNQAKEPHYAVYKQTVAMMTNPQGAVFPRPKQNDIRLLELGDGGAFRIWEIALISQDGHFFLTKQCAYEARCYRGGKEGDKLVCPQFVNWPDMLSWLEALYAEHLEALPHIGEQLPPQSALPAEKLAPETARVIWWNLREQYGMAAVDKSVSANSVARIHWSQVAPRSENGLAYLTAGELIRYQAVRSPAPSPEKRATSFVCELVGVRPA